MTSLLLTHLQNSNPKIPLPTLLGALSHHLSIDPPSPAPLTAATISSPFFLAHPLSHEKLQGLVSVFRHAVNARRNALVRTNEDRWTIAKAIFSKGVQSGVEAWVRAAVEGLRGGRAILRLSCLVGLLLGLHDLERSQGDIAQVEDGTILALAEIMDIHDQAVNASEWEKEFQPLKHDPSLSLALILASQSLPLIPTMKLRALPLSRLNYLLTSVISSAFGQGTFLALLPEFNPREPMNITKNPSLAYPTQEMASTPVMMSIAGLSRLTALVLGMLIDGGSLREAGEALEMYRQMAGRIEQDWKRSKLSAAANEEIVPTTRDLMKTVWLLLKTLLFSTIMVADGVLGNVVFSIPKDQDTPHVASWRLAETVLRTLFHISFVVSQFGGVIVTATSEDPGFSELRKVFYLAIDVLSSGELLHKREVCERFVKELIDDLEKSSGTKGQVNLFEQAKTAYTLACVEQLVSLLGEPFLRDHVWGLCVPFLADPSHRETYESAHSVVLAILASHAQQNTKPWQKKNGSRLATVPEVDRARDVGLSTLNSAGFVPRMVPFYAQCLIENSENGHLNTQQIRLAYSALVRSASASTFGSPPRESFELAWYCIELILDKIWQLTSEMGNVQERLHRLHLTLISAIPSLPLPLMICVLDEMRNIIVDVGGVQERKELTDALFAEILENIGDQEKEASMRWWYANRPRLAPTILSVEEKLDPRVIDSGQDGQPHIRSLSRL